MRGSTMHDVIRFLERLGQNSELRMQPLDEVLATAQLDAAVTDAFGSADYRALETLLGAQANVFCGQHAPGDDEDDDEDDEPEEDDDEEDALKLHPAAAIHATSLL